MLRITALTALVILAIGTTFAGGTNEVPQGKNVVCVPKCPDLSVTPWYKVVAMYPANRALDAMDVVRVSISSGPGLGANVRATNLVAAVGSGNYSSTCFGMRGRIMPAFEDTVQECGIATLGNVCGVLQNDPTEIGATVHAYVGANVAMSVSEAVDFVAGILFLDPQKDDLTPSPWD